MIAQTTGTQPTVLLPTLPTPGNSDVPLTLVHPQTINLAQYFNIEQIMSATDAIDAAVAAGTLTVILNDASFRIMTGQRRCSFFASGSSAVAVPNATMIFPINTVLYNGGAFSLSGGRVTVNQAGLYQIRFRHGAVNTSAVTAAWCQSLLYKNAALLLGTNIISYHPAGTGTYQSAEGTAILLLNAGDIIDMRSVSSVNNILNTWVGAISLKRIG